MYRAHSHGETRAWALAPLSTQTDIAIPSLMHLCLDPQPPDSPLVPIST